MNPSAVSDADVVVVGAGPGGATAAAYLAQAGLDVLAIEKERFPRDKVCGDGLTPRVVEELLLLGLKDEAHGRVDGWATQRGLRIHGGHTAMELPWPTLDDWPNWGATCTRAVFDETIARTAVSFGARLWEGLTVVDLHWQDDRRDRVAGVVWQDEDGRRGIVRAPVVVAADGASSKIGIAAGLHRRKDRPMAVAVRTYYRSPRADDDWISSFLDLKDGAGNLLSGYGWVFPLDDGTLNVGLGLLSTSKDFQGTSYRKMLDRWATGMADEWGTTPDARTGSIGSGPIPMGFNRTPLHRRGMILVGDAGGMVNPFNGEGISYAIEAGVFAAEAADEALRRRSDAPLAAYERRIAQEWGGYYTLGRLFVKLIGHPEIMRFCTVHGMPRRTVMNFVFRLMAHLVNRNSADATDRVINGLSKMVPAA